jgi:DNA-binding GntR family transcriptional regulator
MAPNFPGPVDASPSEKSASDIVFFGILGALETRRIAPGQRLVEADLVTLYDVSRNSVREALQRLAAEGLVEIVRNKGAVIRLLSVQETLDVLEVAERISGLLARSAARAICNGADGQGLVTAIESLDSPHEAMEEESFGRGRRAYYRALLELSSSRELRRLIPIIQMPIVHAQNPLPALRQLRVRDYRAVAHAVLKGDEGAADLAAMEHVDKIRKAIVDIAERTLQKNGEVARQTVSQANANQSCLGENIQAPSSARKLIRHV